MRLALALPVAACVSDQLTPDAAWPVYHLSPTIPEPPDGWKLEVRALRGSAALLTLDDVMKLPRVETRIRHYCVEGWTAVADWTGVRVSDLAKLVGANHQRYVEFRSFDAPNDVDRAYWSSWDRESALHPQTLVAYARNGVPLTPAAGAPLRLVGAVKRGYKQVKYLREVNFLDRRTGGYWENQGYEWSGGV
jgi:DMSO/TMAO reductase YedYZ molybdopterin-dependent catalytic subunit